MNPTSSILNSFLVISQSSPRSLESLFRLSRSFSDDRLAPRKCMPFFPDLPFAFDLDLTLYFLIMYCRFLSMLSLPEMFTRHPIQFQGFLYNDYKDTRAKAACLKIAIHGYNLYLTTI